MTTELTNYQDDAALGVGVIVKTIGTYFDGGGINDVLAALTAYRNFDSDGTLVKVCTEIVNQQNDDADPFAVVDGFRYYLDEMWEVLNVDGLVKLGLLVTTRKSDVKRWGRTGIVAHYNIPPEAKT